MLFWKRKPETGQEHWKILIDKALSEALPKKQVDRITEHENELTRQFLAGEISARQLKRVYEELEKAPGCIKTSSIDEYIQLIKADKPSNEKEDERVIRHESAHFNAAKELGLNPLLAIRFYKIPEQKLRGRRHYTTISWADNIPDNELREKIKHIAQAPENPSPNDKNYFV